MSKSKKICKKDEGVAIMLEDGGGIGFENKLWDNVNKRSMKTGGNLEFEWIVEFTNKNTGKFATKVTVKAKNRIQAKAKSCIKTGLSKKNHIINIYEKMAKGSNIEGLYEYDSIDYEQKNDYEKGQLVVIRNEDLGKDIITKISKITKDSGGEIYSTVDGGDYYYTQILGIVVNRLSTGGGLNKKSTVDVEDIKAKMYNWFTAWLGNFITDEELVNSLKRKLGTKWFRFFKGDTMASDWQSVQNSMKTKNNRDFLRENMQIALDEKSLEIYNSKGVKLSKGGNVNKEERRLKKAISEFKELSKNANSTIAKEKNKQIVERLEKQLSEIENKKLAKGGSLESELPSDTEQLVKDGKVTYRGMGFGASGVKLKVKGKEYIVSDEKFKALGGISKIKFDAPFRKFGKGTTIEGSEVSLHLPIEMSVYVPSTKDANVPVSKSELSKRVNQVKEYLANLFGGYSSSQIIGGYASNEGSLIQEDVVKVISFATKKAYEENKQKLINKIANWSTLWSQEAIGFELEGDLYYINQDKKMALGGVVSRNSSEITSIINRAYLYKVQVIDLKFPNKFIDRSIKNYTEEDYKRDLKILKYFDINLLWDKSYWGISVGESITIIATEPYTRLKKLLSEEKYDKGGNTDCGCHKKMARGGNTDCGCWHYEIGGL